MSLTQESPTYKPFRYPWCYESWLLQQQLHWLPEEVPLAEDVKDWTQNLTPEEKNLVTQIFRFFTQSDVEVNDCYHKHYSKIFKPVEVTMMLTAFSNMETIHIAAYSHLLDTIGMPETEYAAFLQYQAMRDKHDFLQSFNSDDPFSIAVTLAAFGAFTEGLALFASFAILLNFPRFNKMKGMGQIVTWSVRDETLHCQNIIRLFHTWVAEHPEIDRERLNQELYKIANQTIAHEDAFINLAFEMGSVQGLEAADVKRYIRYIGNIRLQELGLLPKLEAPKRNPLPWLDQQLLAPEHANFFEQRSTEYSKAATEGNWGEVKKEFING